MNEAFEKILERLEEKLKKSEERYHRYLDDSNLHCMFDRSDIEEKRVDTIKEMIEIVHEVAEEYKGGWIPCSERLPEEYTVLCCDIYGETIVGHPYFDEVSDTNYSAESDNEMMYNCVAWRPLPEPYKERDQMITYEDECCGCATPAYPCMGDACPNRNVPHLYCDRCKEEADTFMSMRVSRCVLTAYWKVLIKWKLNRAFKGVYMMYALFFCNNFVTVLVVLTRS